MYFGSKSAPTGVKDGSGGSGSAGNAMYSDKYIDNKDRVYSEKDIHREEVYSSYVQFQRGPHEYSYPVVPDPQSKYNPTMSNSTSFSQQPKKPLTLDPLNLPDPPLLPTKTTGGSVKKKRYVICSYP